MTRPPLELQEGQLVRVEYQEGRTQWWWAHYDDASVRPGEIGMLLGRTSDRWFENYRVRLIGRGHDVAFAARELNPCDLAAENETLRAQAEAGKDTLESVQVIKDLGELKVLVPMTQDPATGERFIAPDVAELAHNVTQAMRAQAEANAGEIEALRDEHEALRLAENGSHPQLRRLRGRIEELVREMEAHQLSVMRVASVRERVEEARRWAAAALAQADAGGEG